MGRGYTSNSVIHSAIGVGIYEAEAMMGLCMLIGEQGIDWQYYNLPGVYWRKWAELNRN